VSPLVENPANLDDLPNTALPLQDRRYNLAALVPRRGIDAPVRLRNPTYWQVGNLNTASAIRTDVQIVRSRYSRLNLYPKGKMLRNPVRDVRRVSLVGHWSIAAPCAV